MIKGKENKQNDDIMHLGCSTMHAAANSSPILEIIQSRLVRCQLAEVSVLLTGRELGYGWPSCLKFQTCVIVIFERVSHGADRAHNPLQNQSTQNHRP